MKRILISALCTTYLWAMEGKEEPSRRPLSESIIRSAQNRVQSEYITPGSGQNSPQVLNPIKSFSDADAQFFENNETVQRFKELEQQIGKIDLNIHSLNDRAEKTDKLLEEKTYVLIKEIQELKDFFKPVVMELMQQKATLAREVEELKQERAFERNKRNAEIEEAAFKKTKKPPVESSERLSPVIKIHPIASSSVEKEERKSSSRSSKIKQAPSSESNANPDWDSDSSDDD